MTSHTGFFVQTPFIRQEFSRSLLSWDPESCVTSGIFTYESGLGNENIIMPIIRGLRSQARHPMSLIMAVLESYTKLFRSTIHLGLSGVLEVEHSLGLVGVAALSNDQLRQPPQYYSKAHARLVEAHARCNGPYYNFISASTASVTSIFDTLRLPPGEPGRGSIAFQLRQSRIRVDNLQIMLKHYQEEADSLLPRIDLALRVVSCFLSISCYRKFRLTPVNPALQYDTAERQSSPAIYRLGLQEARRSQHTR